MIKGACYLSNLQNLISCAAKGDRSSFETLIQMYSGKLTAIAKYFVQEEANDIIQQVWIKIWKRHEHLEEVENMEAWLSQVTRYQCLEYLRSRAQKNKRAQSISFDENYELIDALIENNDNPEKITFRKETVKALKRYISELKELYALPITLYYFEGFTLAEISLHMNLPISTIKWRLYTGRQLLKKIIMKGGFFNDKEASC